LLTDRLTEKGITKALVLNDLHVPFNLDIMEVVEKHKNEISMIVFGGDVIDCDDISKFPRLGKRPLVHEMIQLHRLLKQIDKATPNVEKFIISGNHENRFAKHMALNRSALNDMHGDNILREVTNGFMHYDRENGTETRYEELTNYKVFDEWYCQIYDLVVCHPLDFSRVNAKIAVNAVEYFLANGFDFNAIAVGHTHKQAQTIKYGKWTCETGCMCQEMQYAKVGKLGYTPQVNGYLLASFQDGQFDANESKAYLINY